MMLSHCESADQVQHGVDFTLAFVRGKPVAFLPTIGDKFFLTNGVLEAEQLKESTAMARSERAQAVQRRGAASHDWAQIELLEKGAVDPGEGMAA